MFSVVLACTTLVVADASRIKIHQQNNWGATCEQLQTQFGQRVTALREGVEAMGAGGEVTSDNARDASWGRMGRIRMTARMLGLARTTRRARECSWLLDNSGDDLEQLRAVTGTLMASNPCRDAANAEMQAGQSEEDPQAQMATLSRAMSILVSDDCEVTEAEYDEEQEDPQEQMEQAEDELQERLNELVEDESGVSFLQLSDQVAFPQVVGVFLFAMFLVFLCLQAFYVIGFFLASILAVVTAGLGAVIAIPVIFGTAIAGTVVCAHEVYNSLVIPYALPDNARDASWIGLQ